MPVPGNCVAVVQPLEDAEQLSQRTACRIRRHRPSQSRSSDRCRPRAPTSIVASSLQAVNLTALSSRFSHIRSIMDASPSAPGNSPTSNLIVRPAVLLSSCSIAVRTSCCMSTGAIVIGCQPSRRKARMPSSSSLISSVLVCITPSRRRPSVTEIFAKVIQYDLGEAVDRPQRRPQHMRHRIREALKLPVRCLERENSRIKRGIQLSDLLVAAPSHLVQLVEHPRIPD